MDESETVPPARRDVLRAALATIVVLSTASVGWAQQKTPQKLVQYQQQPKADQECDKCLHWVAPDSCKLVEGKINPKGWCALYAPKPK